MSYTLNPDSYNLMQTRKTLHLLQSITNDTPDIFLGKLEAYLKEGNSIDAPVCRGTVLVQTLLMEAASEGQLEKVEILLKKRANVHIQLGNHDTALELARNRRWCFQAELNGTKINPTGFKVEIDRERREELSSILKEYDGVISLLVAAEQSNQISRKRKIGLN